MNIQDKLIRARIQLQKEQPFWAYLALNLVFKENNEIETIGVNAKGECYYNSEWTDKLSEAELKGVLCHEVGHLAFEHLVRRGKRDSKLFNISADLVINDLLLTNGLTLAKDGLLPYNHKFKINNKLEIVDLDKKPAEKVYDELFGKLNKQQINILDKQRFDEHAEGQEKAQKGGGKDGNIDRNSLSPSELKAQADKWKRLLVEAGTYAKQIGRLPNGVERLIGDLLNPQVNWRDLLYRYITQEIPNDYTYSRPSRRSQAVGVYLPAVVRNTIDIVVAIDTSGSISQEELSEFMSEIVGISKSFNAIKITCLICDCEIKDVLVCENGNIQTLLDIKVKGGGGTSHKPVFEWIQENKPDAKLLVALTDGYTNFPNAETTKTIWAITKGGIADEQIPFGAIVRLGGE